MFGAISLFAFRWGEIATGEVAGGQTMAFLVLSLSQIVQAFNMRSERSLFRIGVFTNHTLNGAALAAVVLSLLQAFSILFIPSRWQIMIVYGLIIICIMLMFSSTAFVTASIFSPIWFVDS